MAADAAVVLAQLDEDLLLPGPGTVDVARLECGHGLVVPAPRFVPLALQQQRFTERRQHPVPLLAISRVQVAGGEAVEAVLVTVDHANFKPVPVPDAFRERIAAYLDFQPEPGSGARNKPF